MNEVYEWFVGLATISGFLYFLAGVMFAYVINYIRCKIKHKDTRVQWRLGGIAIGVAAIVITSFQSQAAYGIAQQTAQDARNCQIEFTTALAERGKITSENDEISQAQRRIVFDWIHDLILPPPPYSTLDPNAPERQAYALARTQETERRFAASIARQDELQQQRAANPYPDPTCGK
jgi:hypothetical protein